MMSVVVTGIVVLLSMVLGAAGVSKWFYDHQMAGVDLENRGVFTAPRTKLLGACELGAAFWLLSGVCISASHLVVAALFAAFFGYRLLFRRQILEGGCQCMLASMKAEWGVAAAASACLFLLAACPIVAGAQGVYPISSLTRGIGVVLVLMVLRSRSVAISRLGGRIGPGSPQRMLQSSAGGG